MISYAYMDSGRGEESIIYAIDCTISDRTVRMYCPNPDCDAHMYVCNVGLSNGKLNNIKPYFRATRKAHPHSEGCQYAKINFYVEDYNEIDFDFVKATERVMKPSKIGQSSNETACTRSGNKLAPHTIKQIYELAISNSIDFSYNGTKMWQLLADKRSAHIYRKGIYRDCLVEAIFAGYKVDNKSIRLKYYTDKENFHYLKLSFNEDDLFRNALKTILEAKPSPVIVWGQFKPVDYYFKTIIYSLNQIYIPK